MWLGWLPGTRKLMPVPEFVYPIKRISRIGRWIGNQIEKFSIGVALPQADTNRTLLMWKLMQHSAFCGQFNQVITIGKAPNRVPGSHLGNLQFFILRRVYRRPDLG